jgi:hypothetical protein
MIIISVRLGDAGRTNAGPVATFPDKVSHIYLMVYICTDLHLDCVIWPDIR